MGQAVSGYNPNMPSMQASPQRMGAVGVMHVEPDVKEPDMDADDSMYSGKGKPKNKKRMKRLPPQPQGPQKEPHRIMGGQVKPNNPMLEMMGGGKEPMKGSMSSTPYYKK